MLLSLSYYSLFQEMVLNPLNVELNPICHLLALLGGATIVVVSRLRVKHIKNIDTFIEYTANQVSDFIVVCEAL